MQPIIVCIVNKHSLFFLHYSAWNPMVFYTELCLHRHTWYLESDQMGGAERIFISHHSFHKLPGWKLALVSFRFRLFSLFIALGCSQHQEGFFTQWQYGLQHYALPFMYNAGIYSITPPLMRTIILLLYFTTFHVSLILCPFCIRFKSFRAELRLKQSWSNKPLLATVTFCTRFPCEILQTDI